MNLWNFFVLFILITFSFQNCGSFEGIPIPDFYPYRTKPDFFYDLKLIRSETDKVNRRRFDIDIAISYSRDPNQSVNYEVQFSTLKIPNVCPTKNDFSFGDKKRVFIQCLIPIANENLFVQLILKGPGNESFKKIYQF